MVDFNAIENVTPIFSLMKKGFRFFHQARLTSLHKEHKSVSYQCQNSAWQWGKSIDPALIRPNNIFFFFFFFFSTGLVRLYIAGLPLRSCRTIGAHSVQGSTQRPYWAHYSLLVSANISQDSATLQQCPPYPSALAGPSLSCFIQKYSELRNQSLECGGGPKTFPIMQNLFVIWIRGDFKIQLPWPSVCRSQSLLAATGG